MIFPITAIGGYNHARFKNGFDFNVSVRLCIAKAYRSNAASDKFAFKMLGLFGCDGFEIFNVAEFCFRSLISAILGRTYPALVFVFA